MYYDFFDFLSRNIQFIILFIIIYLFVRAVSHQALIKRAIGKQSIWIDGNHIDVQDFFDNVQQKLRKRNYRRVEIHDRYIPDGYLPNKKRHYMRIVSHHLEIYLTAFPIEKDGVISYWMIAKPLGFLAFVQQIPWIGKFIVEIIQTPTLHDHDVIGATRTMIEEEIEEAIKEATESFPTKRLKEEDFTTYLQMMTTKKK